MSPLCYLRWHSASRRIVRNRGLLFSRCTRCGRDLVWTAAGGWHVPRGYRIVWKTETEAQRAAARMAVSDGRGGIRRVLWAGARIPPAPFDWDRMLQDRVGRLRRALRAQSAEAG